ncbi:hypothetical protein C8A05DRAFT_32615 [Staphylotrichum tortipilum]|uniref:Uncharacterized protein n=1 Tax=Staphylotrichum tortipilum TaxID=2831512 RepID=A0AAN6RV50_9PEZI|nr:hypothetical protein C8A05DRAFT_32615 [Staphylotrichum longicolle]
MDVAQSHNNATPAQPYQALSEVLQYAGSVDESIPSRYYRWQDVLDAMEAAVAQDQAKANKSSFRARVRKSASDVALLESLAEIIPDQDGLSVLRCGLATLFKMVAVRLETRATILQVFEDIPETFADAVDAALRFPSKTHIRDAVVQLGHTLDENVAELILARIWNQRPGKESETVRGCLAEIERAVKRVKQCSQAALEKTAAENLEATRRVEALIVSGATQISQIASGVTQMSQIVSRDTELQNVTKALEGLREEFREELKDRKRIEDIKARAEIVWSRQPPSPRMLEWTEAPPQQQLALSWPTPAPSPATVPIFLAFPAHPPFPLPLPSPQISRDDLLAHLDVPDHSPTEALSRVLQRSTQPRLHASGRAQLLLAGARFRAWLSAHPWESDLLLVDGHCGALGTPDKITPMSALCASLATILTDPTPGTTAAAAAPPPLVLHHFCALHLARDDPLAGPAGLLRSLLHQLLREALPPLAILPLSALPLFLDHDSDSDSPHSRTPTTPLLTPLLDLLKSLLPLLPRSRPIFLLVDSISTLETALDGWRDGAQRVVDALLDLVEEEGRPGPALRVLLVSAERSMALEMPADRRVGLRGGWFGWGRERGVERDVVEGLLFAGEERGEEGG